MFAEELYLITRDGVEYINWRRDAQRAFVVEEYSAFEIMLFKTSCCERHSTQVRFLKLV
jgi:hypothetical protein